MKALQFLAAALVTLAASWSMSCSKRLPTEEVEQTTGQSSATTRLEPVAAPSAMRKINVSLEGVPEGVSEATQLDVRVRGENLLNYVYKLGPASAVSCEEAYDYTMRPVDAPIQDELSRFPDGEMLLCVVVLQQNRIWQRFDQATKASWSKQTGALPAPKNLKDFPDRQKVSLFWESAPELSGYLVVRSTRPIVWMPENGQSYEPGTTVSANALVLSSSGMTNVVDSNVQDGRSYYYSVFGYDASRRYSPPVVIGSIPGAEAFTWVKAEEGAYLKNAVASGPIDAMTPVGYVCRSPHRDANGTLLGVHPGKYLPRERGKLNGGECWYTFGPAVFSSTDYEVLVTTRGSFADWFTWQSVSGDAYGIPAQALKVSDDADGKALFACRGREAAGSSDILGKSFGNGCHMQASNGFLKIIGPHEILLRK